MKYIVTYAVDIYFLLSEVSYDL